MVKSSILNQYMDICNDVLSEVETKLNKSFKGFIIESLLLYMVIPQRINYLQLGRYSHSCEQRFKMNSAKNFDWLSFNLSLPKKVLTGTRKAIAIDPIISRFRDDAVLFYPTTQPPTGKRGRPKLYDSKIDFTDLDLNKFEKINLLHIDKGNLYSTIAYSKSLKQMVKLVVWISDNGKKHKLYFSTDINLSGKDVIETYRTRFQIEFNFRDAKQFTGLNQCQARNLSKLKFNFNASLTAVNVAKFVAKEKGISFSMASLKTMMHNAFLPQRFICVSGIRPNKRLNDKLFKELIEFDAIAA